MTPSDIAYQISLRHKQTLRRQYRSRFTLALLFIDGLLLFANLVLLAR